MTDVRDEWRLVVREPAFRWACLLLAILTLFCLWNGARFAEDRAVQAQAEIQRSLDKREGDKETLRKEEAGETPVNPWGPSEPTHVDWNAARGPGPLAMLSFGREDIEPLSATVSLGMTRTDNLFRKYQFGSPLALAAGRFDAGFLVVLLLPLFVLALGYNVVSQERESGRLRLVQVQGAGVGARMFRRLLLRLSPVYVVIPVILGIGLVLGLPAGRALLWSVSALLYIIIWTGIVALIAALPRRSELLALLAAGLWLFLAILLPAIGQGIAQAVSPTPSSFEIINGVRDAEVKANRRLMENLDNYVSDHPELMDGDPTADDWAAKLYVSQMVVEKDVAPIVTAHQQSGDTQARWLHALRFLSPTATLDQLLADIAGTGPSRQRAYEDQAAQFLLDWRAQFSPMIFKRERVRAADIDGLPRFTFKEPKIETSSMIASIIYLFALGMILLILSYKTFLRFDRY